jgi:tellurite methyltransferase
MPDSPLIDVRPERAFLDAHAPGAAHIPLEELAGRVHELPAVAHPLRVFDVDPQRSDAAAEILRHRGHVVTVVVIEGSELTEPGPSHVRLWRPSAFLVRSLKHIRLENPAFQSDLHRPRAIDIACGTGRDAVYLAMEGFEVDVVDVLPDAIERAVDLARRCGVKIKPFVRDLSRNPVLPAESYDLVTVFRFLIRPLLPVLRDAVAPGGYIVCQTFHERNGTTGRRPTNPDHLLRTGELRDAFAGFDVLIADDAVEHDGRFFSEFLGRRR